MEERQRPNRDSATTQKQPEPDSGGSLFEGIITKVLLMVIILLLMSLPVVMIKFNIGGIGEKARPFLENVKYAEKILPPKPDSSDPKYMSKSELIEKYTTYKNDNANFIQENDKLKKENAMLTDIKQNYQAFIDEQKQLEQEKDKLKQEQQQLVQDKEKFFEDIKNEKKTEFKEYFEMINKEKAEELYKQILNEQKEKDQVKEYIELYEKMEADSAADNLNEMSKTDIDLVVKILKNMKKEQAAEILSGMDASTAAKVSIKLSKEYSID